MKRREFCRSALATAVAATIPGQYLLAGESQHGSQVMSAVQAITASGKETTLEGATVREL